MAQLWDSTQGKIVDVEDNKVPALLRSKLFLPSHNVDGKDGLPAARMVGPDGSFYRIPLHEVPDAIEKDGFRLSRPADEWEHDNPVMGNAMSAAVGALNAGTVGFASPVLDKLTGDNWSQATAQQHPVSRYGTEIGGGVALALAGGLGAMRSVGTAAEMERAAQGANVAKELGIIGEGVANPAAEVAAEAVRAGSASTTRAALKAGWGGLTEAAKYTPTGLVARGSAMLQESMAGLVTKELLQTGKPIGLMTGALSALGSGAGMALGAAPEAALYAVSQAVNERALGDPREWGSLLASSFADNALFAFGPAFGAGALKGALSAVGVRAEQKIAAHLGKMVETGEMGRAAISEEENAMMKMAHGKLKPGTLQSVKEKVPELYEALGDKQRLIPVDFTDKKGVFHPAGSIFSDAMGNALPEGEDLVSRLKAAEEFHGSRIGAKRDALQGMQLAASAPETTSPGGLPKASIGVDGSLIAQKINELKLKGLPEGISPAQQEAFMSTPYQRMLAAEQARFETLGNMPESAVRAEISRLDEMAFKGGDPGMRDAKLAQRRIGRIVRDAEMEGAGRFLPPEHVAEWKDSNQIYSAVKSLNKVLKQAAGEDAPLTGLVGLIAKSWKKASWIGSMRASMAMRNTMAELLGGHSVIPGMAGLAMIPPAIAIGAAGHMALGGFLPAIMPTTERMGSIAHRAASYQQWGKAISSLDNFVADSVSQWTRKPGLLIQGTRIIGEQVLKAAGGDKDDASEAARKLQMRFSALMSSPDTMAQYSQHASVHLQDTAPTAAAAFGARVAQHAMLAHTILQQLHDSRPTIPFQPALSAKLPFSSMALSEAGRQLSAISNPKATWQRILSGVASDKELQVFKLAHPELYLAGMQKISQDIASSETRLTSRHLAVLQKLGFRDGNMTANGPTTLPSAPQTPPPASRASRSGQLAQRNQGSTDSQAPAAARFQHLKPEGSSLNHSAVQQLSA